MRSPRTGRCCSGWRTGCWAAGTTPRTSSRRRTCAGYASTGPTVDRAAPLPVPGGDPPGAWTGYAPDRPPGRRTSGRGCPSRCRPHRRRSGRWNASSCATRSPPRCCTCWSGSPRRSARSTCCTPPSNCRTPRSPNCWTGPPRTAGSCTTGRASRIGRDQRRFTADRAEQERLLDAFIAAAATATWSALTELVAADATAWSDGGGRVRAARNPVHRGRPGRPLLARDPTAAAGRSACTARNSTAQPRRRAGRPRRASGTRLTLATAAGRITDVFLVANPDKLAWSA